jgi:hypothetical protein
VAAVDQPRADGTTEAPRPRARKQPARGTPWPSQRTPSNVAGIITHAGTTHAVHLLAPCRGTSPRVCGDDLRDDDWATPATGTASARSSSAAHTRATIALYTARVWPTAVGKLFWWLSFSRARAVPCDILTRVHREKVVPACAGAGPHPSPVDYTPEPSCLRARRAVSCEWRVFDRGPAPRVRGRPVTR